MGTHDGRVWRKSSYSNGSENGACVEVAWRKSSYSNGTDSGACVEVAFAEVVAVRDSKNVAGPMITIAPAAWRAFVGRYSS